MNVYGVVEPDDDDNADDADLEKDDIRKLLDEVGGRTYRGRKKTCRHRERNKGYAREGNQRQNVKNQRIKKEQRNVISDTKIDLVFSHVR